MVYHSFISFECKNRSNNSSSNKLLKKSPREIGDFNNFTPLPSAGITQNQVPRVSAKNSTSQPLRAPPGHGIQFSCVEYIIFATHVNFPAKKAREREIIVEEFNKELKVS